MPDYNLPDDQFHLSILFKFQKLKNQILHGRDPVKGSDSNGLPPDKFVTGYHRLHDLIRGFYKPKGWKSMLSYMATEKDDNYGKEIIWIDEPNGIFDEIVMRPPSGEKDKRAKSDIQSARYAMENKIPIGIIQNIDKGKNRSLGLGLIVEEKTDGNFIVKPITIPEDLLKLDGRNYFSIRTKDPDVIINHILTGDKEITIGGIYQHSEITKVGDIVFLVLGGDNPKGWTPGLRAICTVSREPYDHGYDPENKKYFRIDLNVEIVLPKLINRPDLVMYRNCYDIIFIGPMTKWEPNQANQIILDSKEITLVRAILDFFPECEVELNRVFGVNFMEKVKSETEILYGKVVKYGETPTEEIEDNDEVELTSKYEPNVDSIIGEFKMDRDIIESFADYINTNKHIVYIGPPGTGKTSLAERASEEAKRTNYIYGYILTTATADWSTFDTIGGYMPSTTDGTLEFHEGIVLRSIRENKWIIIDEINRAEADKAFGHLLTVLTGRDVLLPFKSKNGQDFISIKKYDGLKSYFDESQGVYYVGKNWRILATMNTYDKNSLFALSYAFMRRFAFVHIPIPNEEYYNAIIDVSELAEKHKSFIKAVYGASPKPIGPAVIIELIKYISLAGDKGYAEGLSALVVPQYEGMSSVNIIEFYKKISLHLNENARIRMKTYLGEFFEIAANRFAGVETEYADTEETEE